MNNPVLSFDSHFLAMWYSYPILIEPNSFIPN